jgi:hypothetical protein
MKDFQELKVWQKAHHLARQTREVKRILTGFFPKLVSER